MTDRLTFTISQGYPNTQKDRVVRLFWQAFKGKLFPVMKPEDKALSFLRSVIDPKHAISAIAEDGTLIGIAGFKTGDGAFIGGGLKEICATYGRVGGVWRGAVLSLLERPLQSGTLLMDGIFVSEEAQGQGIGSALLAAIKTEARTRGCHQVRLDVIDSNQRARALYERQGFTAIETTDIGPLRHIFGFRAATSMTCKLA